MKLLPLVIAVASMLVGVGCAKSSSPNAVGPYGVFTHAGLHEVTRREYRVDPPDELTIKAPDIKELDGQKLTVRTNGTILLDLIGEVMVAGKTPTEIAEDLTRLTSKYYVQPEIRVEVVANSKFYYVFGNGAGRQGKFPYTGRVTVISAVADAGCSMDGWPQQIRVSRPGRYGSPNSTIVVDFTKMASEGDLTQNYLIEEGDILDIPFNPLAQFNYDVSRLISPFTGSVNLVTTPLNAAQSVNSSLRDTNRR